MRTTLATLIVALLLLALGGCATQEVVDQPFVLDVAGPLGVDIRSFNGHVYIDSDERYETATVHVVRRAEHGRLRMEEAEYSLPEIGYTVEIVAGELGQVLQVRTFTSHPEPHFQAVDVHIQAPDVAGVFVRTGNGNVEVRGGQGAVDISTTNGEVRVMTRRPMVRPVTIVNKNGDIHYRIRAESTGRFDCETVYGQIVARAEYGSLEVDPLSDRDTLKATFNGGSNRIALRTVNGDIVIAVVENPEQVGWFIMD